LNFKIKKEEKEGSTIHFSNGKKYQPDKKKHKSFLSNLLKGKFEAYGKKKR